MKCKTWGHNQHTAGIYVSSLGSHSVNLLQDCKALFLPLILDCLNNWSLSYSSSLAPTTLKHSSLASITQQHRIPCSLSSLASPYRSYILTGFTSFCSLVVFVQRNSLGISVSLSCHLPWFFLDSLDSWFRFFRFWLTLDICAGSPVW